MCMGMRMRARSARGAAQYVNTHILKNEWNKWKNHFYEMKGDVGMSSHEKEGNKKMPTPRQKVPLKKVTHRRKY